MKNRILIGAVLACLAMPLATQAVTTYDANITAIFGGGNPNGGWTENTENNFQLALRGKDRTTGATAQPNTLGVYEFNVGDPWNFEFSINSDANGTMSRNLTTPPLISYLLSVDVDGGLGVSFNTYNPLAYPDNSLGNNSTANGAGVEPGPAGYAVWNIAQNSERPIYPPNFIGDGAGIYDFILSAYNGNQLLNTVSMQVRVGSSQAVPDGGGTLALLGIGVVGLFGAKRKLWPAH